jgi:23S rRNA (guanine2445-N2)-methyltransferase
MNGRGFPGQWSCLATCSRGTEAVLADEMVELGLQEVRPGRGAVGFAGGLPSVYRANLWLRTAMRVLVTLAEGAANDRDSLYRLAAAVPWEEVVAPKQDVAVTVAGEGRGFRNAAFAALVVKDALVDRLRRLRGRRPDVDREDPDVRVHLHLAGERAGISLDASGEPLAHRGYRPRGGPAPLAECLAAAILRLAGYDGRQPFLDPLCGTGTLAIEAALLATATAPGLERSFACERWHFHEGGLLADMRQQARSVRRPPPAAIAASDIDERAVTATRRNARAAGISAALRVVEQRDVRQLGVVDAGTVIVCNPPYGRRLGEVDELRDFFRQLGDGLKRSAVGCVAWLLVGNRELVKEIGLRPSRRVVLFNGPIECRLLRYDIYEGSRDANPRGGER